MKENTYQLIGKNLTKCLSPIIITGALISILFFLAPAAAQSRNDQTTDTGVFVSPQEVFERLGQKQNVVLVDVRPPEAYDRLHIPGSLNIPLSFVKTKGFLKNSRVVLCNKGFTTQELIKETRRLGRLGFSVLILSGGLNAWRNLGGPLLGDGEFHYEIQSVSPQELFQEKDNTWLWVLDIRPEENRDVFTASEKAIRLPGLGNEPQATEILKKYLSIDRRRTPRAVLLVDRKGESLSKAANLISELGMPVFVLSGGAEKYTAFERQSLLARMPREQRIQTMNACLPCKGKKDSTVKGD